MSEPSHITFNQQVSQSIYLFWLVEPRDLGTLVGLITINMVTVESYWLIFYTLIACGAYVVLFRAGRPRGYDVHLFASYFGGKRYLRPGRAEVHDFIRDNQENPKP